MRCSLSVSKYSASFFIHSQQDNSWVEATRQKYKDTTEMHWNSSVEDKPVINLAALSPSLYINITLDMCVCLCFLIQIFTWVCSTLHSHSVVVCFQEVGERPFLRAGPLCGAEPGSSLLMRHCFPPLTLSSLFFPAPLFHLSFILHPPPIRHLSPSPFYTPSLFPFWFPLVSSPSSSLLPPCANPSSFICRQL